MRPNLLALATILCCLTALAGAADRPHIVYVLADDLGWKDVGFHGSDERRKMRDNTLVIFHSDNGGPRSAKFTGEVDTSKFNIPCDNGSYRDGKASLYEGGTRVVALANWPARIPPARWWIVRSTWWTCTRP
jgi:arylsulfatase A-like enzyme